MACTVTYILNAAGGGRPIERGSAPKRPTWWRAQAWLVLPSGEKFVHSTRVRETARTLIPVMDALFQNMIATHGNVVTSAGWSASTH